MPKRGTFPELGAASPAEAHPYSQQPLLQSELVYAEDLIY